MVEVIVEYDYIAKEPDELTIKKGDIIKDVTKKSGGWWEGFLHDKRGVFPDNFVKAYEKDENKLTLRTKKDKPSRQCKVVFSYVPNHEDELTLKINDIIEIIGDEEEGWWRGILNGKEGVFPSNFVEEITATKPKPSSRDSDVLKGLGGDVPPTLPAKPLRQICEVKYGYKAQNDDELTLVEGDVITVLSRDGLDPGWWKGELRGKIGVFPDNFVVLVPQSDDKSNHSSPSHETSQSHRKPDSVVNDTPQVLKPSAQRKSLIENKTPEKAHPEEAVNNKQITPPLPGKKPPTVSLKKSPSGPSSIFAEFKKKLVDVVDGSSTSKPKTEVVATEVSKSESNNNSISTNVFDEVERKPLLQDVRATRVKAPGRRLPKSIYKEDEEADLLGIPNGNSEPESQSTTETIHSTVNILETSDDADVTHSFSSSTTTTTMHGMSTSMVTSSSSSTTIQTAEEDNIETRHPKLREWEKHKAPWLEEMKLNQAKRTSTSPGPENRLKLTPTMDETSKSAKNSPEDRHTSTIADDVVSLMDMSKSMSALSSLKAPAVPSIKSKPVVPPPANRLSFGNTSHTVVVKESAQQKLTKVASSSSAVLTQKLSPKSGHFGGGDGDHSQINEVSSNSVTNSDFTTSVLDRLHKLEVLVENQHKAIEDLTQKLRIESELRLMMQEKLAMQNA